MSKKETAKRYALAAVSLFFSGMGVALTKHGELGVSPISSVANVISYKFSFLSLGKWLIIWNCVMILSQILLLRKNFRIIELLQLPVSFLFGYFTDLGTFILKDVPADIYAVKLLFVLSGTLVMGFGIALSVIANAVMNSGEALVRAVCTVTGGDFGHLKIGFDVSCVILSVILSLIFFPGRIVGTREGTVICALLTGFVIRFFTGLLKRPVTQILKDG